MTSCADCPDLADSPDRPKGKLRATCCRDDYLELRRIGDEAARAGALGLAETRALADANQPNRAERRKLDAKARKKS